MAPQIASDASAGNPPNLHSNLLDGDDQWKAEQEGPSQAVTELGTDLAVRTDPLGSSSAAPETRPGRSLPMNVRIGPARGIIFSIAAADVDCSIVDPCTSSNDPLSVGEEDGQVGILQDCVGGAAEDEFPHAGVAKPTHHQEVRIR